MQYNKQFSVIYDFFYILIAMNSFYKIRMIRLIIILFSAVVFCYCAMAIYNPHKKDIASSSIIDCPIKDIRLGMRTVGANPKGRNLYDLEEPNESWFQINLHMLKQDSNGLDIELLRPKEWLEIQNAKPGNTIYIDMPEMGAVGDAKVVSVLSAPHIQQGKGNIVTGKYIHTVQNCIDLFISGQDKPIGCTDNHPFWSQDRNDFITAGELLQGERVLLYNGETAKIIQKLPRPGPETVYNIEVFGEHVYCVGEFGVLVHNKGATTKYWKAKEVNGRKVYQRDDLFEWTEENIKNMKDGKAPIGKDGKPVQLHHLTQSEPDALAEVLKTLHSKVKHKQIKPGESFRRNPELNKQYRDFRENYWKERLRQHEKGVH